MAVWTCIIWLKCQLLVLCCASIVLVLIPWGVHQSQCSAKYLQSFIFHDFYKRPCCFKINIFPHILRAESLEKLFLEKYKKIFDTKVLAKPYLYFEVFLKYFSSTRAAQKCLQEVRILEIRVFSEFWRNFRKQKGISINNLIEHLLKRDEM